MPTLDGQKLVWSASRVMNVNLRLEGVKVGRSAFFSPSTVTDWQGVYGQRQRQMARAFLHGVILWIFAGGGVALAWIWVMDGILADERARGDWRSFSPTT